jgi:8-oxo-dGTP pyrophosphatase MutT (NUDIX family)/phosphohistidine phosphatase SixA
MSGTAIEPVVRASGGLVLRGVDDGGRLVALVHRPRYDDWSFPKGKLLEGETDEEAALREVLEETGIACRLGRELGTIRYHDREGRRKIVRYWVMRSVDGTFTPTEEVDELRWVPIEQVGSMLSYMHDRELVDRYLRVGDAAVYLVRHAKAGARSAWTEADELRPLSKNGRRQANGLVKMFRGLHVDRVVSSPYVRCVQTVRPLALDRGLPVEVTDVLAEGSTLEAVMGLLEELSTAPAVVCSHGDVIPAIVEHAEVLGAELDGPHEWKKGSVWVAERQDGHIARLRYLPPPA